MDETVARLATRLDVGARPDLLALLRSGQLDAAQRERLQSRISSELPPVAITASGWSALLPAASASNSLAASPSPASVARLVEQAKSVGRLLRDVCPSSPAAPCWQLQGSLFLAGSEGLAITSCHSISSLVEQQQAESGQEPSWKLRADAVLFADFGFVDPPIRAKLFPVSAMAGHSPVAGYDVALLSLSRAAADGTPLPPALELERRPVQRAWGEEEARIYLIGFPRGGPASAPGLAALRRRAGPGRVASPGVVVGVEPRDRFNYLAYHAQTDAGFSGAPLIDLASHRVIGVHHYADEGRTGRPALACAESRPGRGSHLALAAWNLLTDPLLKLLLPPAQLP